MWSARLTSLLLGGIAAFVAVSPGSAADAPAKAGNSRITGVTIYPNSALVTREVDVPEGKGAVEVIAAGLPAQTLRHSLYSEGSAALRVLSTRFRTRQIVEDTRADVLKLQDDLAKLQTEKEKIDGDLSAVQANLNLLNKMENYTAATAADKGALNSEAAIALSKYVMEGRLARTKDLIGLQQQLKENRGKADTINRKLAQLSAGVQRSEYEAVIVVDRGNAGGGKVRMNYLVGSAAWRPQYKLRAGKAANDKVELEYLAAVVQQTGENWNDVEIVLSTAQPMLNATPPDLHVLRAAVVPPASVNPASIAECGDRVRLLRAEAQQELNAQRIVEGCKLCDTAAAMEQSFELLNPAAVGRSTGLVTKEGPSVIHRLRNRLTVPSRDEEQVMEVMQIDFTPEFYFKAVPVLTPHVYRLADLVNKSNSVLLPGETDIYLGSDFVGRMNLPLVAAGERFTAGFGVDPQLQVSRQLIDRSRDLHGGNQILRYRYRLAVNSFKNEKVQLQLWDRLPRAENDALGVSLVKSSIDVSRDAAYKRDQWTNGMLRWDLSVDPGMNGEKALAVTYEFTMELDKQLSVGSFAAATTPSPTPAMPATVANSPLEMRIRNNLGKLSPEDRRQAEAQRFCAVIEGARLGSRGTPIKVMVKGQPAWVCCGGCQDQATQHPDQTLAKLQQIIARVKAASPPQ